MPLTPVLPKVDANSYELEPEPECLPAVPATLPAAQQQLVSPAGVSPTNPFAGASNQPAAQPYVGAQAHAIIAQPVQAYSASTSEVAPPAYSSTPGIPLVPADTGGTVAQRPPPPYEAPGPTAQPPPFQHPGQQLGPSWAPNAGVGSEPPPPGYNSDPFAPAHASVAPTPSNAAFSTGQGMSSATISAASPFGHTPFDGTGGPNALGGANVSAGNPFGVSAITSSNGFVFDEPTGVTPAPAAKAGVDFPANLPPHLGGPGSSQTMSQNVNPAARTAQGATRTSNGGWQTFE